MRVFDLGIQTFDTQTFLHIFLYNGDDYDVVGFLGGLGSAAPEYPFQPRPLWMLGTFSRLGLRPWMMF